MPIIGQYLPIGDAARIFILGWSAFAPWSQWRTLEELLEIGVTPALNKTNGPWLEWVAPGGATLNILGGDEGAFFEALLNILANLSAIRLAVGDMMGYYRLEGQNSRLSGGHWESAERLNFTQQEA